MKALVLTTALVTAARAETALTIYNQNLAVVRETLSLDLKDPRVGQAVIDVTREAAPAMLERLWLCSQSWQSLLDLRGRGVRLVDSTRLQRIKEGPERRAATLMNEGIDVLDGTDEPRDDDPVAQDRGPPREQATRSPTRAHTTTQAASGGRHQGDRGP